MTEQVRQPEVELALSNLNLPEHVVAFGGVARYRQTLRDIEAGGGADLYAGRYDATPTRRLVVDSLIGNFDNQPPFATRLHQTWAEGFITGAKKAPNLRYALLNLAGYILLPEVRRSMKTLRRMSRQLGTVPFTIFPDKRGADTTLPDFHDSGSSINAAQVCPEIVDAHGSTDDWRRVHDSLWAHGVQGVIIDNHHLVRGADNDPERRLPWRRVLDDIEETGTLIAGLHVSAGRQDAKHPLDRARSQHELQALLDGPEAIGRTIMGQVIARSFGIWQHQRDRQFVPDTRESEAQADLLALLPHYIDETNTFKWRDYFEATNHLPTQGQINQENRYRQEFYKRTPSLPVTVEIPYRGLLAHFGKKRLGRQEFADAYQRIGRNLLDYFAGLAHAPDTLVPASASR